MIFLFGCFWCAFPDGGEGTNVNDVAVALIGEETPPVGLEVSPEW